MPTRAPGEISQRNFWLNVADGTLWPAGYALMSPASLLPLFIASMTQSKLAIGAASAVIMIGMSSTQLLGAWGTQHARDFWRWFLASNGLWRLTVLPLAACPFVTEPWRLPAFYLALALYALGWGVASPIWSDFIGRLVPARQRGSFYGWRGALQGPASMLSTLAMAWLLGRWAAPWSFAACFFGAFVLMSLSWGCMALTRVPWPDPSPERTHEPFWRTLPRKAAECPELLRYGLLKVLLLAGNVGTGFYLVAAQERFSLSPSAASLLGLALLALPSVAGVWLGRLGDRHGPRSQLWGAIAFGVSANLVLALAPNLPLYLLGLLLAGMTTGLLFAADCMVLYEACPKERATYFGLFALMQLPANLAFPLLAGALGDAFGMPVVFAVAACCWGAGGMLLVQRPARVALPA